MVAQIDNDYLKASPRKAWIRILSYLAFEGRPLTTRGRWINPLVFANAWLIKKVPTQPSVNKPLFIVGTGRSGTTVLGLVLSMHKDIGFLNEPKALWHAVYKGEDLVGSYTDKSARYRLNQADASEKMIRELRRLYSAYESITGCRRVLDKYPELIFRMEFVRAVFPDARFICLVRNGIDTCLSIDSWSNRHGFSDSTETHDWWGKNDRKWLYMVDQLISDNPLLCAKRSEIRRISNHTDRAAIEWILTMQEGLRLMEESAETIMMVRYEDLVENPVEALKEIFRFSDLDVDWQAIDYATIKLRPQERRLEHIALDPLIQKEFDEMMRLLGYTN